MIDLHVDFIIQQRLFRYSGRTKHRALFRGQPMFWHADLPRMVEAGYTGACLGIHYFPWESERGWREMNTQIAYLDRIAEAHDGVRRVWRAQEWLLTKEEGVLGIAPGVEGAHMLNKKVERVADLARLGVQYLTLVHLGSNSAATTAWGWGADDAKGLTPFGEEVVRACEEHDVLIDLAHVNHRGVLDACALATRPVMCTHSGARSLHDHPRLLRDEAIDAIAATGGVIGVIFGPAFLSGKLRDDTSCILDHIEYIADRVGVEHAALGSDFDGWMATIPSDMRDCRDIINVPKGLEARGWASEDIEAVCRGNALRVLSRRAEGRS